MTTKKNNAKEQDRVICSVLRAQNTHSVECFFIVTSSVRRHSAVVCLGLVLEQSARRPPQDHGRAACELKVRFSFLTHPLVLTLHCSRSRFCYRSSQCLPHATSKNIVRYPPTHHGRDRVIMTSKGSKSWMTEFHKEGRALWGGGGDGSREV